MRAEKSPCDREERNAAAKTLAIVLNDKAELHLYRVLVTGLGGKHPESGGKVLIGIRPGEGSLDFKVLNPRSHGRSP